MLNRLVNQHRFDRMVNRHRYDCWQCSCSRRRIVFNRAVAIALDVIFYTCCCPCICAFSAPRLLRHWYEKAEKYESPRTRRRKKEEELARIKERRAQAAVKLTPRTLPPRIGDELFLTVGREDTTPAESENAKGEVEERRFKPKKIDTQEDCVLFQRFPIEVRRLIWAEVLGRYLLHIRYLEAYKRIVFTRCKHEFGEAGCAAKRCSELMKQKGVKDRWGNVELLPLLQTCRRIYSESVDLLYSSSTFHFEALSDVMNFSLQVLPARMNVMRDVRWRKPQRTKKSWGPGGVEYDIPDHTDTSKVYLTTTPWLECKAPETCGCIRCLRQSISLAVLNGDYVAEAGRLYLN